MNGNSNGSFMNVQNASPSVGQIHNQYSSPMIPPSQHPSNRNIPQASPNYGVSYPQQQRSMSVSTNGNGSSQVMMNQHQQINPMNATGGPSPQAHMARQMSNQAQQQYMQGNGSSQNQQPKFGGYSPQPEGQMDGGPHLMSQGPPMVNQYKMGPGMMQPGQSQPVSAQQAQAAHLQRQGFQNAVRGPQGPQGPQSQGDGSVSQPPSNQNRPLTQSQHQQQQQHYSGQPQASGSANGSQGPNMPKQSHSGPHSAQHTPIQGYSSNPVSAQGMAGGPGQNAQNQQNQNRRAQGLPAGQPMSKMGATQAAQNEVHAKIFRRNLGNAAVVRLIDLIDLVQNEPMESLRTIEFWTRLVSAYFVPSGTIRFSSPPMAGNTNQGGSEGAPFNMNGNRRVFEFDVSSAPRFFLSNVASQAWASLQLFLTGTKFQVLNNGSIFIGSKITVNFNYGDGSTGTANGFCRVLLDREFKIDWVDCRMLEYRSSIGTAALENSLQNFSNNKNSKMGIKEFIGSLTENCQAAKAVANCGLHERAMRTLQTCDMMTVLGPLMAFSSTNNIASPLKALEEFTSNQAGLQRINSTAAGTNGSVSSPSPRTVTQDDPKQMLKKRRFSTSYESPKMSDARGN